MVLVICEKAQIRDAILSVLEGKTDNLNGFIGKKGYYFVPLAGHALELCEPEEIEPDKYNGKWEKSSLPIFFENWKKKPVKGKEKLIKNLKNMLKNCDYVINAGDIDEEGQLLVDEVLEFCNYTGEVKRLNTSDLSSSKLLKCFKLLEDNKKWVSFGKSALARQVADKTFGYSLTRFFTLRNANKSIVHIGRVKIPTLGLLVNRDYQIDNHIKSLYYTLNSNVTFNFGDVICNLEINKKSSLLEDSKILDKSILDNIAKNLQGKVLDFKLETAMEDENAPLPFNLNALNNYLSKKYNYNPEKVMKITQNLRDNYKAITYNRTSSQYLTEEHFLEATDTINVALSNLSKCGYDTSIVNFIDINRKSKAFDDSKINAHHAIIPTQEHFDITKLTEEELNVYKAVCDYYFAQFLAPCKKEKKKIVAIINNEMKLIASDSKIIDLGYRKLLFKKEKPLTNKILFNISDGSYSGKVFSNEIKENETKPPSRYTETSLEDDMTKIAKYVENDEVKRILKEKDKDSPNEHGSIGTAATRTAIIQALIKQGYISKKDKYIYSTDKAKELLRQLPESIKYADTTAFWWVIQDNIANNKAEPSDLWNSVLETINKIIQSDITVSIGSKIAETSFAFCPCCNKPLVESKISYCCSDWKNCDFKIWKKIANKSITKSLAKELIDRKITKKISGFKSKEGKEFSAKLKLDDNNQIKFVFEK